MKFKGRVWKFGDHVDTDLIIPARFLNVSELGVLAKNCFADSRPNFAKDVEPGDIIVAGTNFGCGSSREHAPLAIKAAGISLIIADSFARIFYRNAFNIGLPILEMENAGDSFKEGDLLKVDLMTGEIQCLNDKKKFLAKPIPPFMQEIISAGGVVNHIRGKEAR